MSTQMISGTPSLRPALGQHLSWWQAERTTSAKVLVVGCGALGNEVLKNLAMLGIGNITAVDFDVIENHNRETSIFFHAEDAAEARLKTDAVSRQIAVINPEITFVALHGDVCTDIGLGHFDEADVIISCVDNRRARLFINQQALLFDKVWIDGAIENLSGTVKVFKPGDACYECSMSEEDWQIVNNQLSCADVAQQNKQQGRIPTTSISASIIAALQVQEALKVLHGQIEKIQKSHLYYEGMTNQFLRYTDAPSRSELCSCTRPPIEVKKIKLTCESLVSDLTRYLHTNYTLSKPVLKLRSSLVLGYTIGQSEEISHCLIPKPQLPIREQILHITDQVDMINIENQYTDLALSQLGICDNDVITVIDHEGVARHFQLA